MILSDAGMKFNNNTASLWRNLSLTLSMIKFSHSVFALPFALISVLYATNGRPRPFHLALIIIAMITARNVAMTFNRLVDARLDALNPRTKMREIPSGKLKARFAWIFLGMNIALFLVVSALFNKLTVILAPVALLLVLFYSITKRFTHFTQIFLGIALGAAPMAAWIATTGSLSLFACLLGLAVCFWAAGFDLIYSTLDYDFDREQGVHNLVARLGIKQGLTLARLFHALAIVFLILSVNVWPFPGIFFKTGIAVMALILLAEHVIVSPHNLRHVGHAFFTFNGLVAVLMLVFAAADIYGGGTAGS